MTEPATEIAVLDRPLMLPAVIGPPSQSEWEALERQCELLARSNLIPGALRGKPGDIAVIALTGRELRIPPMMALNKVNVIDGKPTLSAELMLALIRREGHKVKKVEQTAERSEVSVKRLEDDEWTSYDYTLAEAVTAGLVQIKDGKPYSRSRNGHVQPWEKYPKAMIWARLVSLVWRSEFSDVAMGVSYTPEELGADVDPFTGEVKLPDEPVITALEAESYLARIRDLPEKEQGDLKEQLRGRGLVLVARQGDETVPRLRESEKAELEHLLGGLEQYQAAAGVVTDDDDVADGLIVGDESTSDITVEHDDAVVVEDEVDVTGVEPAPEHKTTAKSSVTSSDKAGTEGVQADGPVADEHPAPSAPVDVEESPAPEVALPADGAGEPAPTATNATVDVADAGAPGPEPSRGGQGSAPGATQVSAASDMTPSTPGERARFAILVKELWPDDVAEEVRHWFADILSSHRTRTSTELTSAEIRLGINAVKLFGQGYFTFGWFDGDTTVELAPLELPSEGVEATLVAREVDGDGEKAMAWIDAFVALSGGSVVDA